jgi:hypothetical protein
MPDQPAPQTQPDAPSPAPGAQQEPAAATPAPKPAPPAHEAPAEPHANPWDDPKAAQAEIERLRRENGAARTTAKAQAADEARNELAQQIGKALGLVADEPVDPAKLTEQLAAKDAEARQAKVALAVYQAAGNTADPVALLDSQSFLAKVKGIDPSDSAAITAAITEAVAANPRLGAAPGTRLPAPNPAQGSSGSGPTTPAQLSEADVKAMYAAKDYEGIEKARAEGRLSGLLGTTA